MKNNKTQIFSPTSNISKNKKNKNKKQLKINKITIF